MARTASLKHIRVSAMKHCCLWPHTAPFSARTYAHGQVRALGLDGLQAAISLSTATAVCMAVTQAMSVGEVGCQVFLMVQKALGQE